MELKKQDLKELNEMAATTREIYDAFVRAGFSKKEAHDYCIVMLESVTAPKPLFG